MRKIIMITEKTVIHAFVRFFKKLKIQTGAIAHQRTMKSDKIYAITLPFEINSISTLHLLHLKFIFSCRIPKNRPITKTEFAQK